VAEIGAQRLRADALAADWFSPLEASDAARLVPPNASSAPTAPTIDPLLAALGVVLLGFGVLMVFSASAIEATTHFGNPLHYFQRHVLFAGCGLVLMFGLARCDYRVLARFSGLALLGVSGLLVLSVAGFGHSGGGAARWLRVGPVNVQPSELAKLALVMWLAHALSRRPERIKSFHWGFLPPVLVALVLMGLCLKQPDFGGAVMLLMATVLLLFVAGVRLRYLAGLFALGGIAAAWLVRFRAYRWERMLAWLNMDAHRHDLAYQPFQAVMGFGSGQLGGRGLGQGLQVLYLPEAHTDFVAAVVGEELGFVGVLLLCAAYLLIVMRGVRVAVNAADDFGAYLAFGISSLFGLQALINLSVAMALLPTKGLTLPFVSSGGSSLLASSAAFGLLLAVSRRAAPRADANGRLGALSRFDETTELPPSASSSGFDDEEDGDEGDDEEDEPKRKPTSRNKRATTAAVSPSGASSAGASSRSNRKKLEL
jgi:cell division protein FtsW